MSGIKSLQNVCLEILKEVDRVCRKHNILYWLEGGTMLGAVRHRGFIPWDDDLDIAMFREDYDRFCEIAPQELQSGYFLQTRKTDSEYPLFFAKVRKNNTFIDEKSFRRLHINKGIFIDIFPVDKMPPTLRKTKRFCFSLRCFFLFYLLLERNVDTKTTDRYFLLFKIVRTVLIPAALFKKQFAQRFDKKLQKYNHTENVKYTGSLSGNQSVRWVYKKEWHESFIEVPFEDMTAKIPVGYKKEWHESFIEVPFEDMTAKIPVGYDELLTNAYGNYMNLPPKEKQIPEHGLSFSTDVEGDSK